MPSISKKSPALLITRFPFESAWGGEESHTLTLARHFRESGYEVVFLGNCSILLERFKQEGFATKKAKGGQMIVTPKLLIKSFFAFPLWRWNIRRAFRELLKDYEIKALYCHSLNEKLFLTPLALKNSIPITWVEHQEIRDWLLKSPWKWLYKKYAKRVKIVPISPKNKVILLKNLGVPEKNVVDIVHGIELREMMSFKRKTEKRLIVAANRLIPKKGMMDILKAAYFLLEEGLDLKLEIIGEGEEELAIRKFIADYHLEKRVQLSPPLKKEAWYQLLTQADVYVSAARDTNETFSLNTAEALAAGCKVVVTNCSGIAHYLEDEKEAFLAKPKDPKALADRIQLALSSPETMRTQAQQAAETKFDLKRMLREYSDVIFRIPNL